MFFLSLCLWSLLHMRLQKCMHKSISIFNLLYAVMEILLFQENGSLSISPEALDYILFCIIHFLSIIRISKTFVLFLRMSSEYLTRYGQGSVFKIHFQGSIENRILVYISLNIHLAF